MIQIDPMYQFMRDIVMYINTNSFPSLRFTFQTMKLLDGSIVQNFV